MSEAAERPVQDWYLLYATRKGLVPEGWRWFTMQALNYRAPREAQSTLLTGAVVPDISRGKNKGQPNWRARKSSEDISIAISVPQMEAFCLEWEAETGLCHVCQGSGQEWIGWSAAEGRKTKPCSRCGGSGKAVQVAA